MAKTAHSLHLYDLIVQDVFQWAMCFLHSVLPCMHSWINSKEAFYPPYGFSQSSMHNRVAKVGMHHKPSILSQLVCLDANLLQFYIFKLLEIILKCQSVLFITFLGEKFMAETAYSIHLYDLILKIFLCEPCVFFIQSCLVCILELTGRRPFFPPMGFPRVPGIIGFPK